MLLGAVALLATSLVAPRAAPSVASILDAARSSRPGLQEAYAQLAKQGRLRSFGCIRSLPVAQSSQSTLSALDMATLTRLPINAFIPCAAQRGRGKGLQLSAGVAAVGVQMLLAAAAVEDRLPLRSLRELAWWQLPALLRWRSQRPQRSGRRQRQR